MAVGLPKTAWSINSVLAFLLAVFSIESTLASTLVIEALGHPTASLEQKLATKELSKAWSTAGDGQPVVKMCVSNQVGEYRNKKVLMTPAIGIAHAPNQDAGLQAQHQCEMETGPMEGSRYKLILTTREHC
jgi:hypothetical protein